MPTTAKIAEIKGKPNKYDGTSKGYGITWYFNVVMDNGDIGQVSRKVEDGLKVGDSITYTVEYNDRNKTNTLKEPKLFGGGGKAPVQSLAAAALASAAQLTGSMIIAGKTNGDDSEVLSDRTIAIAKKYHKWLKENQ